jgi:hypothetical protein
LFSQPVGAGHEIQRFGNFDNFVSIFVKYENVQKSSSARQRERKRETEPHIHVTHQSIITRGQKITHGKEYLPGDRPGCDQAECSDS